jgi:hypothetical protein
MNHLAITTPCHCHFNAKIIVWQDVNDIWVVVISVFEHRIINHPGEFLKEGRIFVKGVDHLASGDVL